MTLDARQNGPAALVEGYEQAIIATDAEFRITTWNAAAERLYGWQAQEVLGREVVEIVAGESGRSAVVRLRDQLAVGRSWGGHAVLQRKDGTEFVAFVVVSPIMQDGKLVAATGVSVPIADEEARASTETLTARERDILSLTAKGRTRAEIARLLGVSIRTVEAHRYNISRKLGLHGRADLVQFAMTRGLL